MESKSQTDVTKELHNLFLFDVDSFENIVDTVDLNIDMISEDSKNPNDTITTESENSNDTISTESEIYENIVDMLIANENDNYKRRDVYYIYIYYPMSVVLLWFVLSYISYVIMEYNTKQDACMVAPSLDSFDKQLAHYILGDYSI